MVMTLAIEHRHQTALAHQRAHRHHPAAPIPLFVSGRRPYDCRGDERDNGDQKRQLEQVACRRDGRGAALPGDQIGAYALTDGAADHIIAEGRVAAARTGAANAQHLLARHQKQMADAEQGREDEEPGERVGEKAEAGADQNEHARAEPRGLRVVAAIQKTADPHGENGRRHGERRRDDAEPNDRQIELNRPIRRRHANDRVDRLHGRRVHDQRDEQAVIDVVRLSAGRQEFGEGIQHRAPPLAPTATKSFLSSLWRGETCGGRILPLREHPTSVLCTFFRRAGHWPLSVGVWSLLRTKGGPF